MDHGPSGQLDAAGKESAISARLDCFLDGMAHALQCLRAAVATFDADLEMRPPDHVRVQGIQFGDLTILDRDETRALRAGLADMAPLQVSGENHMRIPV